MKRLVQVALAAVVAVVGWQQFAARPSSRGVGPVETAGTVVGQTSEALLAAGGMDAARQAFDQRASGRMLRVSGRVSRILADDRDGSPHQRFILETDGGQTLLVAHNLDLAPRLESLRTGDAVIVFGEYEWNGQGGIMHWTHDDPAGRHQAGYIEWRGRKYQ